MRVALIADTVVSVLPSYRFIRRIGGLGDHHHP
jgi:hypothetical protein